MLPLALTAPQAACAAPAEAVWMQCRASLGPAGAGLLAPAQSVSKCRGRWAWRAHLQRQGRAPCLPLGILSSPQAAAARAPQRRQRRRPQVLQASSRWQLRRCRWLRPPPAWCLCCCLLGLQARHLRREKPEQGLAEQEAAEAAATGCFREPPLLLVALWMAGAAAAAVQAAAQQAAPRASAPAWPAGQGLAAHCAQGTGDCWAACRQEQAAAGVRTAQRRRRYRCAWPLLLPPRPLLQPQQPAGRRAALQTGCRA